MKKAGIIFILTGFLFGCSTDFDTIAPWKETMVVYGFLNPNDSIQYIRISKAFLGEGNALVMAQQGDSIYYGDVLDVKMERFIHNALVESHALIKVDTIPKDTNGVFSAPHQEVYAYTFDMHSSTTNDGSIYKLTVTNRSTGNVVTASTKIIEDFLITTPNSTASYKFNSPLGITYKVISSKLGRVYGITQKINYVEINTVTNDTVTKSIDWYLSDKVAIPDVEGEIRFPFASSDLYRLLGDNISVDPNKSRHLAANPIDVYVSSGTEELYTYMQVSQQNTGIVQDKPLYTNIVNGIGLFTCRNTRKISIHLHPDAYAALDTSGYTRNLNFTH
ncbi:MAG: DUF4249 family protein [Bacteroidota bacterium]